ncbi:MAG: tetratricopeptide repeat protein, partial [Candidatus Eisenbacteria bacterium]|nr:tetratricopeptide repeat protein [Candidatus Eisenbacteria bacterium]
IAGFLAALTALLILRRARMNPAGKMLAFSLFILAAPTLIYCGYVESYAYLSIGMLGFLWTGAMAQRGECPPWVPGLFYGIAFFFHTTAVFALPALLLLTFFPGARRKRRPAWPLQILLPALALPAAAIAIHLALGYDAGWFRRDFIESKNQRQLLIGLTGPHGLLGLRHLKDVANWLLLVAPVTGWLIVSKRRVLLARLREPEIAFLAVQVAAFLAPFLLLDRKLGAARDWDLMTPQVAGFALLAARLWEADLARGGSAAGGGPAAGGAPLAEGAPAAEGGRLPSVRLAAFWAALLLTAPWLAMNASREATVRRFDEVRRDFPTFARAYGAEELGKYYYERKEYETSLAYYRECVETYPGNARTRILLGTSYFILNRIDEAQAQYDKALEIDPDNWMALDMKARLALRANDTKAALGFFRRLAPSNPRDPEIWAGYGYAAFYQKAYPEAVEAFLRASQFRFDPRYLYHAGIARALQGEHDAAIELLTRSWEAGMEETMVASALATTLESRYASIERRGESPSRDDLVRARDHLRRAAAAKPEEKHLSERLLHIEEVLAGRTPALILQGP